MLAGLPEKACISGPAPKEYALRSHVEAVAELFNLATIIYNNKCRHSGRASKRQTTSRPNTQADCVNTQHVIIAAFQHILPGAGACTKTDRAAEATPFLGHRSDTQRANFWSHLTVLRFRDRSALSAYRPVNAMRWYQAILATPNIIKCANSAWCAAPVACLTLDYR